MIVEFGLNWATYNHPVLCDTVLLSKVFASVYFTLIIGKRSTQRETRIYESALVLVLWRWRQSSPIWLKLNSWGMFHVYQTLTDGINIVCNALPSFIMLRYWWTFSYFYIIDIRVSFVLTSTFAICFVCNW